MREFKNGQKLKSIFWMDGNSVVEIGKFGCKKIEIVMECGQMAGVAWAIVEHDSGKNIKYNLALCEGVELLSEPEKESK